MPCVFRSFLGALGLALGALPALAQEKDTRYHLFLEAGPVWQGRNEAAVPGNTGTRIPLNSLIGSGPFANVRVNLFYKMTGHTGLRLVVAPLGISGTGVLAQQTNFAGGTFAANTPTEGSYQFNSYRLTYWSEFYKDSRSTWRIGATLKVRDARIALRQNNLTTSDYNLGIVPLVHISGEYRFGQRWRLFTDFDGLAAPQGRAFDLGVHLGYDLNPNLTLTLGYRTLEGGADNRQVYTFAWLNYLNAGVSYRF